MSIKKISEWKKKGDGGLWLYGENVNDVIKKFASVQSDSKYYYCWNKSIKR